MNESVAWPRSNGNFGARGARLCMLNASEPADDANARATPTAVPARDRARRAEPGPASRAPSSVRRAMSHRCKISRNRLARAARARAARRRTRELAGARTRDGEGERTRPPGPGEGRENPSPKKRQQPRRRRDAFAPQVDDMDFMGAAGSRGQVGRKRRAFSSACVFFHGVGLFGVGAYYARRQRRAHAFFLSLADSPTRLGTTADRRGRPS